jgi:hypothetical protein
MCGKCVKENETLCDILYQCPYLVGDKVKIFGFVQLMLVDIWMVLVLALPFERLFVTIRGAYWTYKGHSKNNAQFFLKIQFLF